MIRVVFAAVLAVAVMTVCGGRIEAGPSTCAQPYAPVYVETANYDIQPPDYTQVFPADPVEEPAPDTQADLLGPGSDVSFDMEGDGAADEVSYGATGPNEGEPNIITRSDGVLVVEDGDRGVMVQTGLGDLDGDGHDEVYVRTFDRHEYEDRTFVLPGTTPVGTVDVNASAIRLGDDWEVASAVLGDVVGGPQDDAVLRLEAADRAVEGVSLLAPGPGGSLPSAPAGEDLPGQLHGVLKTADRIQIFGSDGQGPDGWSWERGEVTDYAGLAGRTTWEHLFIGADARGTRFLVTSRAPSRGPVGSITYWNLDDPCAPQPPLPVEATTAPAPSPADPVPGDATFTG